MGATRAADGLPLAGLTLIGVLALVWHDVLPGGWRLRGLLDAPGAAEARRAARHVAERLASFGRDDPHVAEGHVLFLGASTIERFPLEASFPGKPCVNRGVAGTDCAALERLLPRLMPRARPAAIVLHAGGNDWRATRDPRAVAGAVESLARRLPGVPLLLVGLLPERGMSPAHVAALREANRRLGLVAGPHAFLDPHRPPVATPDGSLAEAFSADADHLNAAGYAQLARWIVGEGGEVGRRLAP